MTKIEMAARPETIATTSDNQHSDFKARTTKIGTILDLLVRGYSLNRFEAEWYHDHCLHSTISSIEGWGLIIDRQWERVPCLRGRSTVCCKRYWLKMTPDNLAAARAQLSAGGRV